MMLKSFYAIIKPTDWSYQLFLLELDLLIGCDIFMWEPGLLIGWDKLYRTPRFLFSDWGWDESSIYIMYPSAASP